ncbi:paraquat-inducible protein A [Roseibium limicola]|uniref:Paraquat-inducible protein A n=1 Tax=Roseibium limicola TaxID=2816037 RepID=A0A939ES16_9HYPH|nr:paraquat-inducible protein A [Roseibium limicola]MBO0346876.1 paraquat-inducible protein A [Roseibium limicola]
MRFLLSALLPMAVFSFALGITQPLLRFERLYFLEDRPSLIEMIAGLWQGQEFVLAGVVALFSLGLPGLKLLVLHLAVLSGRGSRSLAVLSVVGKWSMLDVMLVALVVFAAKTSGLAAANVLPGLWFYAAAAVATALAAHLCRK